MANCTARVSPAKAPRSPSSCRAHRHRTDWERHDPLASTAALAASTRPGRVLPGAASGRRRRPAPSTARCRAETPAPPRMDFLVIDDDKTFRDATCFLIEEEEHYAEGVPSGQAGLTRLREEKFDAVLLDLNLGAEKGLEILTEIQKQHPDLPVVMFTAEGSLKTAVEAMRLGAVDFLE